MDLERKKKRTLGFGGRKKMVEWVSLLNGILIKKRRTRGILAKNFKFALGSTLGVDSWHIETQKNDEIIFKKFETLGEGYLLNDQL